MLEGNILGSEPSVTTPCLTWISSVVPILQLPHRDSGFYCPSPLGEARLGCLTGCSHFTGGLWISRPHTVSTPALASLQPGAPTQRRSLQPGNRLKNT